MILLMAGALLPEDGRGQHLAQHQWKHRVVIIRTTAAASPLYREQLREFAGQDEACAERKLALYEVVADSFRLTDYLDPSRSHGWRAAEGVFQTSEKKEPDFLVALIGLDGDIKLERAEVVKISDMWGRIDAMPMRVKEERERRARDAREE
ncbi:MAG: DUF4174 domain-containing protein [Bacteroidota bacterium]